MSKSSGKVVVSVKVPVFGTLKGTKTLRQIASGESAADRDDRPAVITKPLKDKVAAAGR
jgi:hypothetical protein